MRNPPIFGNHTRFRLALNSTVWGALSWCTLIDPVRGEKAGKTNYHFLNYWKSEVYDKRARNDLQKIGYYMFARAQTFFSALSQNPEMIAERVDSSHFLNESLLSMRNAIFADLQNPALRSIFATVDQVISYENFVREKSLDPTLRSMPQLKQVFQQQAMIGSRTAGLISIQNHQATFLSSPFVNLTHFRDHLSSKERTPELGLVDIFVNQWTKILTLKNIPKFIEFYRAMNHYFSRRLTREQVTPMEIEKSWSFLQAVNSLRGLEEPETLERLKKLYREFCEAWNETRNAFTSLEACGAVMRERAFEAEIPIIDDTTYLSNFISSKLDEGHLIRLINTMALQQSQHILGARDHCERENHLDLLYDRHGAEEAAILFQNSDSRHLIICADRNNDQMMSELVSLTANFDENLQRTSLRFDFDRVVHLLLLLTSGKPSLKGASVTEYFVFAEPDLPNDPSVDSTKPSSISPSPSPHSTTLTRAISARMGMGPLSRAVSSLKDDSPFSAKIAKRKLIEQSTDQLNQEELYEVAGILSTLFDQIKENLIEKSTTLFDDQFKELDFTGSTAMVKAWIKSVSPISLAYIRDVGSIVLDKDSNSSSLFKLSTSLKIPFTTSERQRLEQVFPNPITKPVKEVQELMQKLEKLTTYFIEEQRWRKLQEYVKQPLYRYTLPTGIPEAELKVFIPDFVEVKHLEAYLRILHRKCGDMNYRLESHSVKQRVANQAKPRKEQKEESNVYQERVPIEITKKERKDDAPVVAPNLTDQFEEDLSKKGPEDSAGWTWSESTQSISGLSEPPSSYFISESNIPYDVGLRGIKNLGSSCYASVIVQLLRMTSLPRILSGIFQKPFEYNDQKVHLLKVLNELFS
eukprot:TRINITY_DN796_c0_g1_i1.p1 TRINITY_DN796_c0_g1~~TRINITY_DN796_c0_g1_i1.p1  ORF type:complete len:897 (+),score=211.07 TRINITY_DN796_c0_g1_i1:99-2693(+)